jgi:hypothetical protein
MPEGVRGVLDGRDSQHHRYQAAHFFWSWVWILSMRGKDVGDWRFILWANTLPGRQRIECAVDGNESDV